jgi:hypothetical protein
METASSRKRQPIHKRWATTKNPWTGRQERFEIAISDQSFRQWECNRVRLLGSGFPDRPPEIDTEHISGWTLDRTVPRVACERQNCEDLGMGSRPDVIYYGTLRTTSGLPHAMVEIGSSKLDGDWLLHVVVADATSAHFHQFYRFPNADGVEEMADVCRYMLVGYNPSEPRFSPTKELLEEPGQRECYA